ncbi:MAG TPA: YdcF family protein [Xanthobacteraceae bacterium]|nr:YdcF family protein [Xanthobacteraceae bacterium]
MSGGDATRRQALAERFRRAQSARKRARVGRLLRPMLRLGAWAGVVGALVLVAGFFWFTARVPTDEPSLDRNADGIVVLTGGASRIADAVELLASGRGRRLLITGVNRSTNTVELARLVPEYGRMFACCVDLDHSALNTVGNAVEARRWAKNHGFRSLVVVTSSYHMPRAMAELAYQLPDVTLIPFPVVTERRRVEPWWANAEDARLLVSEYLKYIFAKLRMHVGPALESDRLAGNRNDAKS